MSFSGNLLAQEGGGILGGGESWEEPEGVGGGMLRGGPKEYNDLEFNGFGNQPFGVPPTDYAPLGSGVFMLVAAGVGYALVKSRKSETLKK